MEICCYPYVWVCVGGITIEICVNKYTFIIHVIILLYTTGLKSKNNFFNKYIKSLFIFNDKNLQDK